MTGNKREMLELGTGSASQEKSRNLTAWRRAAGWVTFGLLMLELWRIGSAVWGLFSNVSGNAWSGELNGAISTLFLLGVSFGVWTYLSRAAYQAKNS